MNEDSCKPLMMLPSKACSELGKYISSLFSKAKANCESEVLRRFWSNELPRYNAAAAEYLNDIENGFLS